MAFLESSLAETFSWICGGKINADSLDEQEVEELKESFRTIQANLVDEEIKQYTKGETEKVRYDKLKRLAYDIDDVLDEYKTAILKSKIETDHQAQTPSTSSSLSSELHNTPSTTSKIKGLNKRVAREKDFLSLAIDENGGTDSKLERTKTTSFIDEFVVSGRDHDQVDLIDRLLVSDNNGGGSGNAIPLIAIVGMGGLGKTTLARLVFNDDKVEEHFSERIWVCVSDPFDEVKIAKAILESIKGEPSKFIVLQSLLLEIHKNINGKKFLLVLDDVWTEDETKWGQLNYCLSSGSRESRILVTTRKKDVATMMRCSKPILLDLLSDKDSWSLFSKTAFWGRSEEDCENLESIGTEIVRKCGGLPLAIKTLANLLRSKGTKEQWQRILDSEMWELEEDPEIFKSLYAPLLLSYCDLPMSIRRCFCYCAIFPKDYEIKRDELIQLWMAQGFLGETRKVNDLEIMGKDCFDKLAMCGLFQEFKKDEIDGSIIECKMHDVVHDFAHFLTKTEHFIVASGGIERGQSDGIEGGQCHENVRHLSLIAHGNHIIPIIDGIKGVDKLRSFLFQYNGFGISGAKLYASHMPKSFHQLISLRILGFCFKNDFYNFHTKIPKEIGNLIHLRYLSFEGNRLLEELPETLCDLCNLQTLNVRRCNRAGHRGLPLGMEKLINLRHLLNAGSYRITLPKGMKRLTNLQTLEELELLDGNNGRRLSSSDSFSLADLGNLIHLRGKLDIDGLGDVAANELREARLSTKTGLRELSLNFSGGSNKKSQKGIEDDALVLQALDPPQQLLSLEISHCKSLAFPNWMTSLTLLKRVYLYAFYNWESLPPLGKLPFLESLTINQLDKVKKVGEEFLGIETSSSSVDHIDFAFFPNLKVLEFYQMKGWDEWEYECEKQLLLRSRGGEGEGHHSSNTIPTIMPILQHLTIWNCPKLKALPDHLLHSTTLQFTIYNSPIRDLQLPNSLPW